MQNPCVSTMLTDVSIRRVSWHRPPMLFSTGFPVSFDAVMARFRTTNSLLPPIDIGLAGLVCVAVYLDESGAFGGVVCALGVVARQDRLHAGQVKSARK